MASVLIVADTLRSPELRHELPVAGVDPVVYLEHDGRRHVFASALELPRLEAVPGLAAHPWQDLGVDELAGRLSPGQLARELPLRACRLLEASDLVVPESFPLGIADHLRGQGIAVRADGELFDARRRVKSPGELAGIRRAQRAAERALAAIRDGLFGDAQPSCESLRERAIRVLHEHGMEVPEMVIVGHGAQAAEPHDPGSGRIAPGEPVVVDLYPRDHDSGCFADIARTFCLGTPPAELVEQQRRCREALEAVRGAVRPGVDGAELHALACELFERHGHASDRQPHDGARRDGFFHSLGHGIGLEAHERPGIGRSGDVLVAGDVIAIEPGLYRQGFGGCRLEDLLLVTEDGCETLTDFPYELAPG